MGKRLTKKELREDSFLRLAKKTGEVLKEMRIWVIFWIIILSLLGLSVLGLFLLHESEERASLIEFREAQSLFRTSTSKEDFLVVRDKFSELLNQYSFCKLRPLFLLYKGLCEYKLEEWEKVINSLKGFQKRYPNHWLAPSALLITGNALEQKGDYWGAISVYEDLIKKYPENFNAPYAQLSIGRCLAKLGNLNKAKIAYKKLLSKWPNSVWGEEVKFWIKKD
jgi:tetratricopeptide (TPR) repeat protein